MQYSIKLIKQTGAGDYLQILLFVRTRHRYLPVASVKLPLNAFGGLDYVQLLWLFRVLRHFLCRFVYIAFYISMLRFNGRLDMFLIISMQLFFFYNF